MTKNTKQIPQDAVRAALRGYMSARGLSLSWLSQKLGYKNKQTVRNYMSSLNFTANVLKRWSEILGYPYELLVEGLPYGEMKQLTIDERFIEMEKRLQEMEARIAELERMLPKQDGE